MRSAGIIRGLALAISFLLVGVAGGDAGHALAGLEAHGFGSEVPETNVPCEPCDSSPPHDATNCLLCHVARVSSAILTTSVASTPYIAEQRSPMSLLETLEPSTPRRRTETARAPPTRLAV